MTQHGAARHQTIPGVSPISFAEAFRLWLRIGLTGFGGPAGQIAMMHRLLVDEKRWISEERFLHALNYCMLLPGPEAQQLAIYMGWLLHKSWGGIVAGTLFVLPGFVVIVTLSFLYAVFHEITLVQGLFFGIKAAVLAVVVEAVLRIGKRALKNAVMGMLAILAFVAIFFFDIPFPLIVLAAAGIGLAGGRLWPERFVVIKGQTPKAGAAPVVDALLANGAAEHTRPSTARAIRVAVFWLAVWFAPLLVLALMQGISGVFLQEGFFFSEMAVVTFGGAYAVLAYVAQQAVTTYGWLAPGEMMDGLGLAETTPGPLIMVLAFVGFLAAFRAPGTLDPVWAGVLGASLTTWVTFAPCFLWIFLGAPYIESLRGNKTLSAALSAITAAVVGVVLNLGIWFALHVLFGRVEEIHALGVRLLLPVWQTLDGAALVLAAGALIATVRFHADMLKTLVVSAVVGVVYFMIVR
ncbi:MAG: chromate transporter [Rhodospirillaceae bacterium]|nr:MAG: chromate transporter [Rhodospirillaceae bacterium]